MVKVGTHDDNETTAVEVRFDSRETAFHIRSAFVQTKKLGTVDLGTLHISNVVTLATRIRADILRAVSEQWTPSAQARSNACFSLQFKACAARKRSA